MGDALRAFELDAEQQFALRVERPRVAALADTPRLRDAPDRRRASPPSRARACRCRAAASASGLRRAAAPRIRSSGRRQRRVDAFEVMRIAAALDKGAHRVGASRPGTAGCRARRGRGSGGTARR